MTTTLLIDKGRVTIPKEVRTRHGIENGDALLFVETKSGNMVLRTVRPPAKSLLEHLTNFKGVELPAMKFHAAPRV